VLTYSVVVFLCRKVTNVVTLGIIYLGTTNIFPDRPQQTSSTVVEN